jgi:hypothetical protein
MKITIAGSPLQNARTGSLLTLLKPEGTRHVGKPNLRWVQSAEEDLKNVEM